MKYTSVNIRRACLTASSPPTPFVLVVILYWSPRQQDWLSKRLIRKARVIMSLLPSACHSFHKLLIIGAVKQVSKSRLAPSIYNINPVNSHSMQFLLILISSEYSGHHRPDEQELRLSPSQFPLRTIYPAPTVGWMALRPIASSGKLNITHVYPTTNHQQQ